MLRLLWIIICLFLFSTPTKAENSLEPSELNTKSEELETLRSNAYSLLSEMEMLQQEVSQLKLDIEEMEKRMEEAKENLKGVSIASTPARFYLKTLKRLKPQLHSSFLLLEDKSALLQQKGISFGLLEEQLQLLQDQLSAPLLNIISRQFE